MEWYESEIRQLESRRKPTLSLGRPVVFYGSSSIRLWPDLGGDLGDPRIVNLGFGGSTLAACAHFFDRLVVPYRPGSLVLYAGDNDLGDGRSPLDVLGSFQDLVRRLDRSLGPIPLAFISIKPSPARWSLIEAIRSSNERIARHLATRENSIYINVFDAMLGPDGRPIPPLYSEDGLHLSPEGYRVWASEILSHRDAIF